MTNRLMELQDELDPPEPPLPDTEIGLDEAEEPEMAAATAIRRRQQARRPVAGSAARALASARPIRYRVPGSVPLVAAPGSMNTWAAAVTALLSWRERQVMGVEDALGRLGPRWVDLLHRNHGLPVGDKASLLAAAGLAADPPVCYAPDDLELLLRESGPLWVTDDDRGARLFSTKAYLVTGISAPGGRDARLDVIDPATGRSGAMRLSRLHRLLAGGRRVGRPRVQVLHLQQGSPNGHRSATHDGPAGYMPPPPVQQQAVWSGAMNPAVIIAASGLTWQVVKDLFNPTPDITITRARLNGKKHPGDDASWDARGAWQQASVEVKRGRIENLVGDQQSADFRVDFQFNGHSLGNVVVYTTATNDAFGWKLAVEQDIVIRDDLSTGGADPKAAVEVSFSYRHSAPIRDDVFKRARVILYADGRHTEETLAEGQSLELGSWPGALGADGGTAPDAGLVGTLMPGPRAGLTILAELDRIHSRMVNAGHPCKIGSGLRTIDEQIQLYAKGRTFPTFKTDITAAVAAGTVTQAKATEWITYFDPAGGNHPMPAGEPGPVTWTFVSRHLTGDAADIVHETLGWGASAAFWTALRQAAVAEGLQIGPPASDVAHVQRP